MDDDSEGIAAYCILRDGTPESSELEVELKNQVCLFSFQSAQLQIFSLFRLVDFYCVGEEIDRSFRIT